MGSRSRTKGHGRVSLLGFDLFINVPLTREKFKFTDMQLNTKIFAIKNKLELITGIPMILQRLFYLDREDISDDSDLRGNNIVSSATLNLHIWQDWEKIVYNSFMGNISEILKLSENPILSKEFQSKNFYEKLNVALYIAANKGRREMIEKLLLNGADVNWKTNLGRTPLHSAAAQGQSDCIEILLASGAVPDQTDSFYKTPSKVANDYGHRESEKQLFLFQWEKRAKNLNLKGDSSALMMHQQFDSGYPIWLKGKCQQIYMSQSLPNHVEPKANSVAKPDVMLDEKEDMLTGEQGKIENSDELTIKNLEDIKYRKSTAQGKAKTRKKTFEEWLANKALKSKYEKACIASSDFPSTERRRNFTQPLNKMETRERKQNKHSTTKRPTVLDEKPKRRTDVYDSEDHDWCFEKDHLRAEFYQKMSLI